MFFSIKFLHFQSVSAFMLLYSSQAHLHVFFIHYKKTNNQKNKHNSRIRDAGGCWHKHGLDNFIVYLSVGIFKSTLSSFRRRSITPTGVSLPWILTLSCSNLFMLRSNLATSTSSTYSALALRENSFARCGKRSPSPKWHADADLSCLGVGEAFYCCKMWKVSVLGQAPSFSATFHTAISALGNTLVFVTGDTYGQGHSENELSE